MGSLSIWHWVLFLVVAVVLFGGRGKLSGIMGDAAKGIKEFKKGLKDDDEKSTASASGAALPADAVERERERDKV